MIIPFVDLKAQYLSIKDEIDLAIQRVIDTSDYIRGKDMIPFENEFAETIGRKHCISCANGTDALFIALKALNIGRNDEVITTAHSWISTSETITQAGGKVVFCDTDSDTFNIDPALIENKITKRTKGIVVVHLCGQPADIDHIMQIAESNGLWVIEDCAQAHLAKHKGHMVGKSGVISTYSFYPGKNLGAMGDAGCILTDREDLSKWMTLYARHGGKGNHQIEGINSRLDGLQAAILRTKLPYLIKWTKQRQEKAEFYSKSLANIEQLRIPYVKNDREHVYHLYMVKVKRRDELKDYLSSRGISTVINYSRALPFYDAYKYLGHKPSDFPCAYENQSQILSLPLYPELNENQQIYISNCIREFYSNKP